VHHDDGFEELYDLVADPYELDNKAKDPTYAKDVASLRPLHDQLKTCVGDSCWVPYRRFRTGALRYKTVGVPR